MVSIIILSFNTKDLLKDCLESLYTQVKKLPFEIIVVDNASVDGSPEMVKKDFRKVILVENKENMGFSKGCNVGARKAKGEYVVFLNSDTIMQNNSLERLTYFLEEHPNAGVAGGKLENADHTPQRSYGNFYTLGSVFLFLFGGDKAELLTQRNDKATRVDWVNGGFMGIRRDVFEKVKGFDEHIFMYTEDMELCYRVKKLGYDVYYIPDAAVIHAGQASSNRTFAVINIYKGLSYFYKKHKSNFEYIIVKALLRLKAYIALSIGIVTNNSYLKKTYLQLISI